MIQSITNFLLSKIIIETKKLNVFNKKNTIVYALRDQFLVDQIRQISYHGSVFDCSCSDLELINENKHELL